MKPFAIWLEASRPKTLIASISPALLGTVLAWKNGSFSPLIFLLTLLTGVAILITYYLQTHEIPLHVGILGLCPGLVSTAILTANNLRDVNEDRRCRKKTLVVRFGETFGRVEYTFCLVAAYLIPCLYGHYLMPIMLLPACVPIKTLWTIQEKKLLNVPFAQTGKLLILSTMLLAISIIYEI